MINQPEDQFFACKWLDINEHTGILRHFRFWHHVNPANAALFETCSQQEPLFFKIQHKRQNCPACGQTHYFHVTWLLWKTHPNPLVTDKPEYHSQPAAQGGGHCLHVTLGQVKGALTSVERTEQFVQGTMVLVYDPVTGVYKPEETG